MLREAFDAKPIVDDEFDCSDEQGISLIDGHLEIRVYRKDWGLAKYITRMPAVCCEDAVKCRDAIKDAPAESVDAIIENWRQWAKENTGMRSKQGRKPANENGAIKPEPVARRAETPAAALPAAPEVPAAMLLVSGEGAANVRVSRIGGPEVQAGNAIFDPAILLLRQAREADAMAEAAQERAVEAVEEARRLRVAATAAWDAFHAGVMGNEQSPAMLDSKLVKGLAK